MTEILKLNSIAGVVKKNLPESEYTITEDAKNPVGILVRSADMLSYEFPESVVAVARAGAGVNNIPVDACAEKGIVVFNTPGANANAVKELVIGTMIIACRNAVEASAWAKTLKGNGENVGKMAEKGKGQFVGPEIAGKTLGVIGLGAIGKLVADAAMALGMNVIGFDPFAKLDNVTMVDDVDKLYEASDIITLHVPQMDSTKGMINASSIAKMKDGVIILNFARGGLIKDNDVIEACENGKIYKYATDFASDALIDRKNVIVYPHLGASTPESEDNCAEMASKELNDYISCGLIKNSVNYPNVTLACSGEERLTVLHKATVSVDAIKAAAKAAVTSEATGVKGDYAYTIIDLAAAPDEAAVKALDGVIRVRVL